MLQVIGLGTIIRDYNLIKERIELLNGGIDVWICWRTVLSDGYGTVTPHNGHTTVSLDPGFDAGCHQIPYPEVTPP